MKYIFGVLTLFLQLSFSDSIYDIAITTIEGNKIELSRFKGKKLLILLLPVSSQDTTVSTHNIARLQTKYQNSLVIIGIPCEDAGYKIQDTNRLKRIYQAPAANIILTEGMKVKKGEGQVPLFQWLTSKDMNRHFGNDVQGAGSKFFVSEEGELYAVMGPQLTLADQLVDRILARSPIKGKKKNM